MNIQIPENRLENPALAQKVVDAYTASLHIKDGMTIGVSGFTPSGYPKLVPLALAERVMATNEHMKLNLYSGASLGPEIDSAWSEAGIISYRMPYQTNKDLKKSINDGTIKYTDMHLSHAPQYVAFGFVPKVDIAIIEAVALTKDGIVPSIGVGNSATYVQQADKVIVELNLGRPIEIGNMADIYYVDSPPCRKAIPIQEPADRIGTRYIPCEADKIAAIVLTDKPDTTRPLPPPDDISKRISDHILAFLRNEVREGRLPKNLLPIQSGVGSVANAVLYGLCDSEFEDLSFYTEVAQDSMLEVLRRGKASVISATAVSPSPEGLMAFEEEIDFFKDKIILRPQEISNSPEVLRRLGVIAINTALEADIYGNVNSTHVMGTHMMNGIGGAGDFTRNAYISIFSTPSTAKGGAISSIVPMASHVDNTEHDVMVLVTEYGYADLRGLSPKERAERVIQNCAHPDYRGLLWDYFCRASAQTGNAHTPHILHEALSWHERCRVTGSMLPKED